MQMKSALWITFFCVMMFGCTTKQPEPKPEPQAVITHPALPSPVGKYVLHWKVIPQDDHVYVALPYDESLQLKTMIEDMLRYARESNSVMCYYRRDLKEQRCLTITPPKSDTK